MSEGNSASQPATRSWNPYIRGMRFEYRTRDFLRKAGWFVFRQPRSLFPDMVALKDGAVLLVECKLNGRMPSVQRKRMVRIARMQAKGKAVLASRNGRGILLSELSAKSARFDKPFDPWN
jgi:Holliday junction resolvase